MLVGGAGQGERHMLTLRDVLALEAEDRARLEDRDVGDAPRLIAGRRAHEPRQESRAEEAFVGLERVRDGHRFDIAAHREILGRRERHELYLSKPASDEAVDRPHPEPVGLGNPSGLTGRRHAHADPLVPEHPRDLLDQVDLPLDVHAMPWHLDLESPPHRPSIGARCAMRRRSKTPSTSARLTS